jgi:predicted kinase/DNA-directed RNA polymerase subunit RPC12/RpoP
MFNICSNCGSYRPDKIIDAAGPHATCPDCGHRQVFLRLPLLIVSGASGAGKSTVCQRLLGQLPQVVLLDSDILWGPHFAKAGPDGPNFYETWLRMAKSIGQSGRPVVLFGAGLGVPHNMEPCIERRYFSQLHYLALVCDDDVLAGRLQRRPGWRKSSGDEAVADQQSFNRWFKQRDPVLVPSIELHDTTRASIADSVAHVTGWIRSRLAAHLASDARPGEYRRRCGRSGWSSSRSCWGSSGCWSTS